ncbi:flavoprotein [Paraphysoderma sedebokerense]|nr:flavoprotein [Paraphysoderma sedebokerense]
MAGDTNTKEFNILLGCTGSVASIKIPVIVDLIFTTFKDIKVNVKVVATEKALHFFDKTADVLKNNNVDVLTDTDEWELRNWADIISVCPIDANTLGKLSNGLCDNLLTCILRAWNPAKPVILAPAMNTYMYHHPLTSIHLKNVSSVLGYKVLDTVEKRLACGDVGLGGMASPETIVHNLLESYREKEK